MRKFLALFLAALLVLTLAACGGDGDVSSSTPESDAPVTSDAPASSTTENTTTSTSASDSTSTTTGDRTTTEGRSRTTTTTEAITTTTAFDGYYSTIGEKPYAGNAAILYNKQTSRFDAQSEKKRQEILNLKDTIKATGSGTTYYISPKGDDENAGTSKDKAWRTTKNLQDTSAFKAGDAILFERGGVYRNVHFLLVSGVSYGAYGTGVKPNLYGSARNYADESLWEKTSEKNVWRIKIEEDTPDVGNLVFDHGKGFALKMMANKLTTDFQFYHDAAKDYVYLYLAAGNPGKLYSDIEICAKKTMLQVKPANHVENVTIENLCIKYTGAHGIGIQSSASNENKNITIRGCEIGWIGGSLLDRAARYGNGIEFNGWIDGALVEDNWVYQCYDTCYTNQGSNCYQKNITVKENLMEYSPYNIEVWTAKEIGKGGMTNCTFKDNILRFAGYGWGTLNRVGSNTSVVGNISFYDYVVPCENVLISGNIFDCSYRYLVSIAYPNDTEGRGPTIEGNTWNQKPFSNNDTTACVNRILFNDKEILGSNTLEEMKASVARVDKAPKDVTLEK